MMSMSATMHPIWQTGAVLLAVGIAAALSLQLLVHRVLPAALRREHTELGAAIFSVIGTTYAVLLAFMAMTAWEQYSAAERLARREADLVGSAYHASYGLPAPAGSALRAALVAYLARVVAVEWPAQVAGRAVAAAEPLLARLTRTTLEAAPSGLAQANAQSFLIGVLSEVGSARRDRRLATHGTIPDLVWVVLLSGGVVMVGMSFVLGAARLGLHMLMTVALVGSGALVLLLIVGLSSPFHGTVTISPIAYAETLAEIQAAP